jgi:photosystem II stability/assembly factor-like uncharacterized protein
MKKNYFFLLLITLGMAFQGASQTASWSALTSGTTTDFTALCAFDANTCYVGGSGGTIRKTIDGGTTWTSQTSGTTEAIYDLNFTDINNGYAVGDNNTALKTVNGGVTWTAMTLPTTGKMFRHVEFINSTTGFITGGNVVSPGTTAGTILKTINAGLTWTVCPITGSTSAVYGINFTSATTGFASEYSGRVVKTTDGGNTWVSTATGSTVLLQNIHFSTPTNGIAVGGSGNVRRTTDGGTSWTTITVPGVSADYYTGIDFIDANNGFISGGNPTLNTGTILSTTNGGASWSVYNPGSTRLYRLDVVNANVAYAAGVDGAIYKYSSNVGINEITDPESAFVNYPNPFSTSTTINFKGYSFSGKVNIEVYDIKGSIIKVDFKLDGDKLIIDRSGLSAGLYAYKIYNNKSYLGNGKMIVE